MSAEISHNLDTTNESLPDGAYHPTEDEFNATPSDDNTPSTVSSVEQLIRVAFSLGGKQQGLELAEKAIEYQKQQEEEEFFDSFTVDRPHEEKSTDPWLINELNKYADKQQEVLNKMKNMYERRVEWFDNSIISDLKSCSENARNVERNGTFKKVVVYNARDTRTDELDSVKFAISTQSDSLDGTPISAFGYETPIELLVVESPSGSVYPFVPWCGTTVCTCGWKHDNPVSTLCKHEIAALHQHSRDNFRPEGYSIPARYTRLTSPEAYNEFVNNIDA